VVDNARIYTLPEEPPKVYVSGLGPKAIELAARIGDGYISTKPAAEGVEQFRKQGGGDKPCQGGFKAVYAPTEDEAVRIGHEKWPNAAVPGELSQVLPSPKHFEQAAELVTEEHIRKMFACGPDAAKQLEMVEKYAQAGFDEVYVANIGPYQRQFFDMYAKEVLPQVRGGRA
jgi:G6PDH family F420-dependent oxidoreductase